MNKILGIFALLIVVCLVTAGLNFPSFVGNDNLINVLRWTGFFGILAVGAATVILTGGIDLSQGSVVGLVGVLLPMLVMERQWPLPVAAAVLMLGCLGLGLLHGLAITKLRLQPFIVTLTGLLIYRSLARGLTGDRTQGFLSAYEKLTRAVDGRIIESVTGHLPEIHLRAFSVPVWIHQRLEVPATTVQADVPNMFLLLLVLVVVAAFLLNRTVWGRYLLALGRNDQAARFSGINTDRLVIATYAISASLAGLAGMLLTVSIRSASPNNFGSSYELYAIAAAVLGGCSLRGGEGSYIGVLLGALLLQVLRNSIVMISVPDTWELTVIGLTIFLGVTADELFRRLYARRQAAARMRGRGVVLPAA